MKFKRINIKNLFQLIPEWAINVTSLGKTVDSLLCSNEGAVLFPKNTNIFKSLKFWIEVDATLTNPTIRFCTSDDKLDLSGNLIVTSHPKVGCATQIVVPLNPVLKGYPNIEGKYVVYLHAFQTDVPLCYFGVSKRRWFERLSQHISSAKSGSPFLFHSAIINHQNVPVLHRVFYCELDRDSAMEIEEDYVDKFSLYPLGLNMIPGGNTGIKYLHNLGYTVKTILERDEAIENISTKNDLSGRPNPLCAARWQSDQNFIERVICGHSGRLTVEQVQSIRLMASFGKSTEQIASILKAKNTRQVAGVIKQRTYSRIK